ncbi:MAG: AAA family ATPase [Rhodospirillaceae bacterium]|nr:AAA family ATPase [Rhodospirillaceae bacterium]
MQASIIEFLSDPKSYGPDVEKIDIITTHISHVFLVGRKAYKLKRALKLPYLDFSTLEDRRKACENEVKLNRRTAPMIYVGVEPLTSSPDGQLAIDGEGETVDWLVEMNRFEDGLLLSEYVQKNKLSNSLAENLAEEIFNFHSNENPVLNVGGAGAMASIVENNTQCFLNYGVGILGRDKIGELSEKTQAKLGQVALLLDRRREEGKVRHCHGDLHLGNIVLIEGQPVLFDAIEFNDQLATIDVMYDLAFLVMDLTFRGMISEANILLNRYIALTSDVHGLETLPLFLSMRAAIRSHVAALAHDETAALKYMDFALSILEPAQPRLIAVGGLSGTGKSSLARELAPSVNPLPGALILRSDVVRKQLAGVDQFTQLEDEGYSPEMTRRTYDQMYQDAAVGLLAGHSVIVDAVFARVEERAAIRNVAANAGVNFDGIWLVAEPAIAEQRISRRSNDASDATVDILHQQLGYDIGAIDWPKIESSANLIDVMQSISEILH